VTKTDDTVDAERMHEIAMCCWKANEITEAGRVEDGRAEAVVTIKMEIGLDGYERVSSFSGPAYA
jgi:hypothetical protein